MHYAADDSEIYACIYRWCMLLILPNMLRNCLDNKFSSHYCVAVLYCRIISVYSMSRDTNFSRMLFRFRDVNLKQCVYRTTFLTVFYTFDIVCCIAYFYSCQVKLCAKFLKQMSLYGHFMFISLSRSFQKVSSRPRVTKWQLVCFGRKTNKLSPTSSVFAILSCANR